MEKSIIVTPDGSPAQLDTIHLDQAEAMLLRQYKKFLQRRGLKEALYCDACWGNHVHNGCEAQVTDGQIFIKCRCTLRTYTGYNV